MSTQLRLVDTPAAAASKPAPGRAPSARRTATKRATASSTARRGRRRAANWGDWRLDARTRTVGRAGVARARQALEAVAAAQELSRAS